MKKSPVVITEPAAVAALKEIYQNNGLGNLEWDFSIPGQVTALAGDNNIQEVGGLQGGASPPSSLETEEALLGAVLLDPETALPNALETGLRPNDFFNEANAEIFRICLKLEADRQPVDQATVAEALKSCGALEKCGGPAYLARLYDGIGLAASAGRYARIIIDRAILRRLISMAGSITERCQGSPAEVEEILDWVEAEILKIQCEHQRDNFANAGDEIKNETFRAILEWKVKRQQGIALTTGLSTGYDELDKITGGLQSSNLIILAARPGLGKTILTNLALNLALNAALPDRRQTHQQLPPATVGIFNLEKERTQLLLHLICNVGRLDLKELRTGWTSDEDIVPLTEAVDRLGQAPIFIDDTPALRVRELRAKARRLKTKLICQGSDLNLVVVDYLDLMRGSEGRDFENREQEISEISRALKTLAQELRLPVVALTELNRKVDKRSGKYKKPKLSDLEFGAIERDADLIAFMSGPEQEGGEGELLILKNKNGPTGKVSLQFEASSGTLLFIKPQ